MPPTAHFSPSVTVLRSRYHAFDGGGIELNATFIEITGIG